MSTAAEQFAARIQPRRRPDREPVEDAEFLAMMWRMVRALEHRTIERPENLPQLLALAQRLDEVANVAIAVNADRYALDPMMGASAAECGRAIGVSKQAASQRRERGRATIAARNEAAGATRFSEAARERSAIEAAANHGVTSLAEYRARHAA